ncbi:SIR2 family NAD-dependent protein deacylase [Clostridium sp. B9]|uniref:SIR2 family NAD-dependent protein deacylase n=1 Tax=Clostridium sp. B9 TaxID=3423224 RepID=UPI003D2F4965
MGNYNEYLSERFKQLKTNMYDSGCRPILFVGTGISRRYINAPDWKGLLDILIKKNPNIRYPLGYYLQDSSDLSEVASKIIEDYFNFAWEKKEGNEYPNELYEYPDKSIFLKYTIAEEISKYMDGFEIEKNLYKEELNLLRNLKPHAIITTNYDKLLEKIFNEKYKSVIGQQVIKKSEVNKIGQIFKIHGCVSKPEEIIISKNDYTNFKKKQKYLSAKLLTYFIEHPIIFIGYSLSDENIVGILNDIADMISVEDNLVENIWLIDWNKDTIDEEKRPPSEKVINLGENTTIRINYIEVNDFIELFKTLQQGSSVEIDELLNLQDTIYNIVKSKTITNLEVDSISFKDIWTENNIIDKLGLKDIVGKPDTSNINGKEAFLNLSIMNDPEQVLTEYPYRISDIASKIGDDHWYRANKIINEIERKYNIEIKTSNNIYHLDVGVNGSNHRYSNKLLDLITKYINGEEIEEKTQQI